MLYKCCTIFIANLAFFTYVHIHTHFSESNSDLKTKAPNQFLRKPTPHPPTAPIYHCHHNPAVPQHHHHHHHHHQKLINNKTTPVSHPKGMEREKEREDTTETSHPFQERRERGSGSYMSGERSSRRLILAPESGIQARRV